MAHANKLEVENLSIAFVSPDGNRVEVVSNLSFSVPSGTIWALVGESGCGKSVSMLALTRLFNANQAVISADRMDFFPANGGKNNLVNASESQMREIRGGKISYIFQDPATSLNPVFRVGDQIAEALKLHRPEIKDIKKEVVKLLTDVGIPDPERRRRAYPHELSGGMQQRIMIAMALAGNPELLIADEPTTALDVTIQAQILELLERLRNERNMTVILITHNLGVVARSADFLGVMYAGEMVEQGVTADILTSPLHPYSAALLAAVPDIGQNNHNDTDELYSIPGSVPNPADYPPFCRFFDRCERADAKSGCREKIPGRRIGERFCRCVLAGKSRKE